MVLMQYIGSKTNKKDTVCGTNTVWSAQYDIQPCSDRVAAALNEYSSVWRPVKVVPLPLNDWREYVSDAIAGGTVIATAVVDPGAISGSVANVQNCLGSNVIAVTGAAVGDPVTVTSDAALNAGVFMVADSRATNNVTITFINMSGSSVDIASFNATIRVQKNPGVTGYAGQLTPYTSPSLNTVNGDTDADLRIAWAAANADVVGQKIVLPADYDEAKPVYVALKTKTAANTSTIGISTYWDEADSKIADTANVSATLTIQRATIAAADIPASAENMSIDLTPGTHAADIIYLYQAWLEIPVKLGTVTC
jgi:hypothetical protein